MPCENNAAHNDTQYCSSCSTCHDCLKESEQANADLIIKLKSDLQDAINERNAAWFLLEENNITIT